MKKIVGSNISDTHRDRVREGKDDRGLIGFGYSPPRIIEINVDFLRDLMTKVNYLTDVHKRQD